MGKTKQEKKFNRNVEISAPILDPEIIKQIHSPPGSQKRDIRHGGFKALLSDLNSQDSTDELTPITENHLPSYIGISCAVSGYSNYSSYGRKQPLDELGGGGFTRTEPKTHKLATTSSSRQTPNRSQTNSPLAVRVEPQNIHHVTIDKSNIQSVDEERKELTEKLTASAAERRHSPSPLPPPTNEDRHHGAYVGARYFPMPEPSKVVNKHIPLLGIDDELDPDRVVEDDYNKVEKKIASLYGENFVEDWKEAQSHKSKKELHDEKLADPVETRNLKEIVNLKPTPPKPAQLDEPVQVDVPTPNVKVLAQVEKQFLNRLLTDENPPTPKSPSPQPTSPTSPKPLDSPVRTQDEFKQQFESTQTQQSQLEANRTLEDDTAGVASFEEERHSQVDGDRLSRHESAQDHVKPQHDSPDLGSPIRLESPSDITQAQQFAGEDTLIALDDSASATHTEPTNTQQPEELLIFNSQQADNESSDTNHQVFQAEHQPDELEISHENLVAPTSPSSDHSAAHDHETVPEEELVRFDASLEAEAEQPHLSRRSSQGSLEREFARSPESQISSSTVERVTLDQQQERLREAESSEEHIEYEIRSESPLVDNESSPVKIPERVQVEEGDSPIKEVVNNNETDNLVSFSPEPTETNNVLLSTETNNNNNDFEEEDHLKQSSEDYIKLADDEKDELFVREGSLEQTEASSQIELDTTNVAAAVAEQEPQQKVDEPAEETGGGHHFLNLLKEEESFIMERVRLAEKLLAEKEHEMDEERLGRIHSAIGKANLLINKKCNQFRELCEKSISGDANDQYAVLNDDLAGFWDMIHIQITDVRKSLENP